MQNLTSRIRLHYNVLSPFYYALWGQHVHHGYWTDEDDQTPQAQAQFRLIWELYSMAGCPAAPALLDVGCGHAGTLLWFARETAAEGVGLTVSPVQGLIGRFKIRRAGLQQRLRVAVADAQQRWPLPAASRDLVWSVECTEHLADRAHFAREAFRVLRPGGTLCVAAWLAGPHESAEAAALCRAVEHGMLCHPFGTRADYTGWFAAAGFTGIQSRMVTPHVARTWDICIALRDGPLLRQVARLLGEDVRAFTASFDDLRRAYAEGAMEYGLFVAHKPLGQQP